MPRHKATKLYLFRFTVEGTGPFPTDMLRYDSCWPEKENEARSLVDPDPDYSKPRTIHLRRASLNGNGPTILRWNSFGWRVTNVEPV